MTCPSGKRPYPSIRRARKAHRRAGFRVRAYRCPECGLYHCCNQDKGFNR